MVRENGRRTGVGGCRLWNWFHAGVRHSPKEGVGNVCECVRKRGESRRVQFEFWGTNNGEGTEGETVKERGRPASKGPDLHEKKHVAILLLTSAASGTTKSGGLLFTDSFCFIKYHTGSSELRFQSVAVSFVCVARHHAGEVLLAVPQKQFVDTTYALIRMVLFHECVHVANIPKQGRWKTKRESDTDIFLPNLTKISSVLIEIFP